MSRALYLARWIIRAELHLVSIMHPSTIRAFDHSRLFYKLFGIHDDVRLPHVIRKATSVIGLNDVLNRNISPCYASSGRYPYDCTCTGLAACPMVIRSPFLKSLNGARSP